MGAGSYAWREQAKHQVTVVDRKEPDTPKPEPEKPETPNPDKPRPEEPDRAGSKARKPGGPEHENPRTPELQSVLRDRRGFLPGTGHLRRTGRRGCIWGWTACGGSDCRLWGMSGKR
ncbi:MAG: hypothetical protein ACLUD2_07735 [Clostridium sp.]